MNTETRGEQRVERQTPRHRDVMASQALEAMRDRARALHLAACEYRVGSLVDEAERTVIARTINSSLAIVHELDEMIEQRSPKEESR